MARDYWQTYRKAPIIDKLNNTIKLPAFSAICGNTNQSLELGGYTGISAFWTIPMNIVFTNGFAFEVYLNIVKLNTALTGDLFEIYIDANNFFKLEINYGTGTLTATYKAAGLANVVLSYPDFPFNSWTRVSFSWTPTSGLLELWINSVLVATGTRVNSFGVAVCYLYMSATDSGGSTIGPGFNGYLTEIRLFNLPLTQDLINRTTYFKQVNSLIDGLVGYWRASNFSAFSGTLYNIAFPVIGLDYDLFGIGGPDDLILETEEYPYLYLGSSYIVATFPVSGLGSKTSIISYPAKPSVGCNFCLAVSWTDPDTDVFYRRKFWTVGENIQPDPALYAGEVLPEEGFTLEIWNIDGNETCDLTSDLLINMGLMTVPTTSVDVTQPSLGTQTIDKSIFSTFPLAANISFTSLTQFS